MAQAGRPKTDNPKSKPIHVRLSEKEIDILNGYANKHKVTKTEAIRQGIYLLEKK